MSEKLQLSTDELAKLQVLNTNFNNVKIEIADCEVRKVALLSQLQKHREEFAEIEKELIKTYGDNAKVNLQTGEVTQPEEENVVEALEKVK
jgi:septal ring factor EnvC (AmiA/AmiB activator)